MLSREVIRKIRRVEISARALVQGELVGHYRSLFKGEGVAFSELREYLAGDDVRAIDWNVSARMGKTHIKLFEEERDTVLMLMVDLSASMYFGTRGVSKRELVADIAAILAFSALSQGDSVGLILFSDQIELYLPPKRERNHVLRILRELYSFEPKSSGTRISSAIKFLLATTPRRGIGILVSDFLCEDWQQSLQRASRRHDMISVIVSGPFEVELPDVGIACFRDMESGMILEFDTGGPEAALYCQAIARKANERRTSMQRMRAEFVELQGDSKHVDVLLRYFRNRAQRRRKWG